MSLIDVDTLLAPVSAENPCGENLEYDPDYALMELAAAGKPEQQFGKTIIPAEEPDWREVQAKALELLGRTKDLRIAAHLVRSATRSEGLSGLAGGLAMVAGLVEQYWDGVHPRLDPEDNNDPTLRLNQIASLADPQTVVRFVREATLVSSRAAGNFSFRDVQVAAGEVPPPAGTAKIEQSALDGAFGDCDGGELKATAAAVKQALEKVQATETAVASHVGDGVGQPLDALTDVLRAMNKLLQQKLQMRGLLDEEEAAGGEAERAAPVEESADGGSPNESAVNGRKASAPMSLTGDISSREDVIRALDKICDYYKQYEPSSPVPLFLNRAKRLASKSFLEILRDLTPDAVNQALAIGGISDGSAAGGGVDPNDV
jgi:type VI secretion system protein ImpA